MGKRIITTENLEEDVKIESSLEASASGRLYWAGKSERNVENLHKSSKGEA